jgi:GrpB-like predicted nucleotidyltransferase (UPF0157 family)
VEYGGIEQRCLVGFRDYLRAHPDAMREYGQLKRHLAAVYGADRDGYTNAKGLVHPCARAVLRVKAR